MRNQTLDQYNAVIEKCKTLFLNKTADYGTSWRILRLPSITDQIFIKAQRIRSIQEKGGQKVKDPITDEFIGIINYCTIALMQMQMIDNEELELPVEQVEQLYIKTTQEVQDLLSNKNHD